MFEIRTFIGVLLLLLIIILVVAKKLKITNFKVLIIGFLFGISLMPFVMSYGIIFGLPLGPFTVPGIYFSRYFYQEQPTRFTPALDKMGKPVPLGELTEEAQRFIAEHPTVPQATPLSEIVRVIIDGIYSAFIFWIVYSLVRKLRNKTPIQG